MKTNRARQQGFAAIVAVFLVVVLAALGAFMVTFSNTQQLTSAQDVQGSRAYWAARAGLEWSVSSAITASACPASPTTLTIDGFSVVVTCTVQAYTDNGVTQKIFQLISVAAAAGAVGSVGYIERSVSASICRNTDGSFC
jgi:MSHA biogenesis protein MshP